MTESQNNSVVRYTNMLECLADVKNYGSNRINELMEEILFEINGTLKMNNMIASVTKSASAFNGLHLGTDLENDTNTSALLESVVVGVIVENASISNLSNPLIIRFFTGNNSAFTNMTCAFWDETEENGAGDWSVAGCQTFVKNSSVTCKFSRLSYFAVLVSPVQEPSEQNAKALRYISYIGCGISSFCMTVILIIHQKFLLKPSDQAWFIHLNLAGAVLLLNLMYLCSAAIPAVLNISWLCTTTGLVLHFSLICSFTWMTLEACQMYLLLWRPFDVYIRHFTLKSTFVGWGVPALIVLTVVAADKNNYGPIYNMCWITKSALQYCLVMGYYGVVFIFTTGMLVAMIFKIVQIKRANKQTYNENTSICKFTSTFLGLTCLLGTTWGLGFFTIITQSLTTQYLFCIINSLYGFFLFLWICARWNNEKKTCQENSSNSQIANASDNHQF
ncbi:adhesion G-protein coupled receptor G5-like isoform X2 [Erpetoichthys calabaricus]|uniref:adhesion G-protein coupled receptor G5-like isoform X2 n=1 Tax=Erpetoichthys calabaricus TaxID=27687 RepID=UPI0022340BFC|nr:adhesion G-protein coupled receptor G5-like isoform X2 [Erpetoichthys calabaricus]